MTLQLRPYEPGDARHIVAWLKDEFAFRQWSADRYDSYPIVPEDVNAYYENAKKEDGIFCMTAVDGAGVIGHFTLRFPRKADKSEARLGFVIVDDKKRGKGYGKQMVRLAVQYAFDVLNVQKVSLGVFENNAPAIGCYEACGFRNVHLDQAEQYLCMGQRWKCMEMQLEK